MTGSPYNPLDKANLAKSIEFELLGRAPVPLPAVNNVKGAGIYVIYYVGRFPAYTPIAARNADGAYAQPIYVGKAIPKGGRKGGLSADASKGRALADRIAQHAASIEQATNLDSQDFSVRYLVVDDIWIPLGENMLIETFKPLWNRAIDGFGNRDPGNRRATQYRSSWDVLHPGRAFSTKLAESPLTREFLERQVSDYLAGRPLEKLPKALEDQQAAEQAEAEQSADEV
ncbi:Eco29kI family restriction endonuclease [Mesorhizobium sp. LNHC209A00]|uniref:Eco29kI family restriction endonuclease n=1 Tax=Mesorhizobium TaxID=68287 RepID=UPI0003D05A88|nr:Eco29kI family restriction endonuclease [Mesorhizobium sp. LNHC209A00]ESY90692.1 hypothetical protein X738_29920 [Mesorhizobium sp. LNHC209A00]